MPPLPKKKHSKKRQGGRSAHFGMKPLTLTQCSQCPTLRLPHRACPACGYYNGRSIVSSDRAE